MMRDYIKEEILELRDYYTDPRRTLIVEGTPTEAIKISELLPEERTWVVMTESGFLSRTFDDEQPKVTQAVKDAPRIMLSANASEILYLFARDGTAATIPVHQLPQMHDFQSGTHFSDMVALGEDQEVVCALTRIQGEDEGYCFLSSVGGMVKRIALEDLPGLTAHTFPVMGLTGDDLGWAAWTTGEDELFLISAEGMAIRFHEDDVRPMGQRAAGVKGIKLGGRSDQVVGMMVADPRSNVWVITDDGYAKSSPVEDFPVQGRYGQGVIAVKFHNKQAQLAAAAMGKQDDTLIVVTSKGKPKYMRFSLAPRVRRNAQGKSVVALGSNEVVSSVVVPRARSTPIVEEE
jgi:DNA gyrase subunit A